MNFSKKRGDRVKSKEIVTRNNFVENFLAAANWLLKVVDMVDCTIQTTYYKWKVLVGEPHGIALPGCPYFRYRPLPIWSVMLVLIYRSNPEIFQIIFHGFYIIVYFMLMCNSIRFDFISFWEETLCFYCKFCLFYFSNFTLFNQVICLVW